MKYLIILTPEHISNTSYIFKINKYYKYMEHMFNLLKIQRELQLIYYKNRKQTQLNKGRAEKQRARERRNLESPFEK